MEKPVKIGVMGCAAIAKRSVIPAILSMPEHFQLIGIASRTQEKAEEFAKEFGCEAIVGYDTLIAREDIDAVYMPLPTGLHQEWINKALKAGKHIYAEKSIALSFPEAKEMVSNAQENKCALMEGYMFQYHSQHQIIFDAIKSGEIGKIRHFSSKFGFPPLDSANFRYDDKIGGGAIMDAAGYAVRSAFFVLGNSMKVVGSSLFFDKEKGTNTYGSAFMSDGKGIGASLAFGFDNYYQCLYEIWGSKGKITADRAFTPRFHFSPKIIIDTPSGTRIIEAAPDNHFQKAFAEFHAIIANDSARSKHYEEILLQSQSLDPNPRKKQGK